jgi:excinuclease UvrABC helicase subunit UvrB
MFRKRGDTLEIFPVHLEDRAWRISLFGDEIEAIDEFDPLTGKKTNALDEVTVYAASHYVTPRPTLNQAVNGIKAELKETLDWMVENGKLLEAQRLEQRTRFDLEMMEATGSCAGIENYSRWLTGRAPASRRRPSSNTSPTTPCCSSTRATSPSARSAPCSAATTAASRPWPNTASASPPPSTTAR